MIGKEAVLRIKQDLARFAGSGEASRLRGIIVKPEVYAVLKQENEKFRGVLRVSGQEGNRILRYSFYVLENKDFPQGQQTPYFFVGYKKEVYKKRYLGREGIVLASKKQREAKGELWTIKEINPILGTVAFKSKNSERWFHNVDYREVLTAAKDAEKKNLDVGHQLYNLFADNNLVLNAPTVVKLVKNESTYNYDKAPVIDSVGRLLMKKVATPSSVRWNPDTYQVVGIGRDGYGNTVEVVMKDSQKSNPHEFAVWCRIRNLFLPEEIANFLRQNGAKIAADLIRTVQTQEIYGTWYDAEESGRLESLVWLDGKNRGHVISGTFINTLGKSYHLDLVKIKGDEGWGDIERKYFPSDWKGWPETRQMKALAAIAKTL